MHLKSDFLPDIVHLLPYLALVLSFGIKSL
jgi:hypothetical protein